MRAMEKPAASHDIDLLPVADGSRFREWLVGQNVRVRSAKGADRAKGILFWVRPLNTPAWLSVDAASTPGGKFLRTHRHLRPYLNEFLLKPLNSSVRKATRETPAIANTNGLGPVVIKASPKSAPAKPSVKVKRTPGSVVLPVGVQLVHEAANPENIEDLRATPTKEQAQELSQALASAPQGSQLLALDPAPKKVCAGTCATPCSNSAPAAPALVLDDRLEDLRDDFALHAPITMGEGESLQAFAARRWEYAKVMMETRPANVRG